MQIDVKRASWGRVKADALVLFVAAGGDARKRVRSLGSGLADAWRGVLASKSFTGTKGQIEVLRQAPGARVPVLIVVGVGHGEAAEVEQAAGRAVRHARDAGAGHVSVAVEILGSTRRQAAGPLARAQVEGAVLGLYRFVSWKAEKERPHVETMTLLAAEKDVRRVRTAATQAQIVAEGVCLARDLGNEPGNKATPLHLAEVGRELAHEHATLTCEVLDEPTMRELGMGALLGVGQASAEPSRMVILTHRPSKAKGRPPTVALVGKGVTFDTGGISIKPASKLEDMKFDMCGGAAVLGAMQAIARLDLPVRVVGIVPAAENMPGGKAYKPGDILRASNGTTIEIRNTDAEGRLLLADALAYATGHLRPRPKAVVDIATLTGACMVALGGEYGAIISSDERLAGRLEEASDRCADALWRLPLNDGYRKMMDSPYADVSNLSAGRGGGASTAAAFLERFSGTVPWAHLDIAGMAWGEGNGGTKVKGATGFGVRALVQLARDW